MKHTSSGSFRECWENNCCVVCVNLCRVRDNRESFNWREKESVISSSKRSYFSKQTYLLKIVLRVFRDFLSLSLPRDLFLLSTIINRSSNKETNSAMDLTIPTQINTFVSCVCRMREWGLRDLFSLILSDVSSFASLSACCLSSLSSLYEWMMMMKRWEEGERRQRERRRRFVTERAERDIELERRWFTVVVGLWWCSCCYSRSACLRKKEADLFFSRLWWQWWRLDFFPSSFLGLKQSTVERDSRPCQKVV